MRCPPSARLPKFQLINENIRMKTANTFACLMLVTVTTSTIGCTGGRMLAMLPTHNTASDSGEMQGIIAESQAIEQANLAGVSAKPAEDEPVPSTGQPKSPSNIALVSRTMPATPPQPTLITLKAGDDLNQTINRSSGKVLLDFYADWCGPCRVQGKILQDAESLAAKTETLMVKINIDEHPELAKQLQVASLPTLMMVENGKVTQRQTGVADKNRLASWMQ